MSGAASSRLDCVLEVRFIGLESVHFQRLARLHEYLAAADRDRQCLALDHLEDVGLVSELDPQTSIVEPEVEREALPG